MALTRDSGEHSGLRSLWLLLAAIPYVATALLFGFAWHTSNAYGAWPSYGQPDPKDADGTLYLASGLLMFAALPSILILVVGLLAVKRLRLNRRDVLLIVVGIVGLFGLAAVFSGNLGDWYVD